MPTFIHEIRMGRKTGKLICGVDEVGRGPLAGPVVAAAAFLPEDFPRTLRLEIRDSKKMSAAAREDIYEPLTKHCLYTVAEASVEEIDRLNILWASMLAMERAINLLSSLALCGFPQSTRCLCSRDKHHLDVALIDGNRAPHIHCMALPIIKGDDKSLSIAAASIIAKIHRDRLMKNLAQQFPLYGWERNVGYGTSEHLMALRNHGATSWHRNSFAPVRLVKKEYLGCNPSAA